jgi:hypothetical protein
MIASSPDVTKAIVCEQPDVATQVNRQVVYTPQQRGTARWPATEPARDPQGRAGAEKPEQGAGRHSHGRVSAIDRSAWGSTNSTARSFL